MPCKVASLRVSRIRLSSEKAFAMRSSARKWLPRKRYGKVSTRTPRSLPAYFIDFLRKHPITDEALKKEYERIKPQLVTKEFRARHILVNTEKEAKEILKQLKDGGSFEKIAAEKSKDTGSKGRGGDLDWSPASRYVKPFGDALVRLKKGQTTEEPVKTDFGWQIIRLDDERVARLPSLEETKPTLQRNLQSQMVQKEIADLRAKAKVQ